MFLFMIIDLNKKVWFICQMKSLVDLKKKVLSFNISN